MISNKKIRLIIILKLVLEISKLSNFTIRHISHIHKTKGPIYNVAIMTMKHTFLYFIGFLVLFSTINGQGMVVSN